MSLPHPVLDLSRHERLVRTVTDELLTPLGLRTLSPHDAAYQGRYAGSIIARDRAHHQGSAFPWLLGPLVSASVRLNGRSAERRQQAGKMLQGVLEYLLDRGAGQICELFDGDAPHNPGGAVASARSVAEILRCYVEDVLDIAPPLSRQPTQTPSPESSRTVTSP